MPDTPTEQRAVKAQVKLADSAKTLEHSAVRQEDSADRRTVLAADRTVLAAERTYAAWIRTGLAALASGVGARALLEEVVQPALAAATGSVLILFSAFCFVAAVWRELRPGPPPPVPDTPAAAGVADHGQRLPDAGRAGGAGRCVGGAGLIPPRPRG